MVKRQPVLVSFVCLVLGGILVGCGSGGLPTSPRRGVSDGEVRVIGLPGSEGGSVLCGAGGYVEGEVRPEKAAKLELEYEWEELEVAVGLHVPAHAVSEPAMWGVRLSADSLVTEISFLFGPAGLEFLRPAKLKIDAEGINLQGVDPQSVGLYCYDESGLWELIEPICLRVRVGSEDHDSEIRGLWWINHFSRYALASR